MDPSNIVPITLDKLNAEQRGELEQMMSNVKEVQGDCCPKLETDDEVGSSSSQGDKGAAAASGDKGDGPQHGAIKDLGEDGNQEPLQFTNFQDWIDYAVQHALINQSGVLVNTLTNMVKSVVDGTIADHQAIGPVYLPGGVFPNYWPLIIGNQQGASSVPPVQPMASVSTTVPAASSSAPRQVVNPRLLTREQPQHARQNVNRLTQDQVATMFLPNPPASDPVPSVPIQQTPPRQHMVQSIQQQNLQHPSARLRTPDNRPRQHDVNQVIVFKPSSELYLKLFLNIWYEIFSQITRIIKEVT